MGFATSIAALIIFISLIIIATITYDDLHYSFNQLNDAKRVQHEMWVEQSSSDVDIIQIVKSTENTLTMTVVNSGSTTLDASEVTILMDGIYTNYTSNPAGFWMPGTEAIFTINGNANQNHDLKIITENGISDIMEYLV